MARITRIQLGLIIGLLLLGLAVALISCGRQATQQPAAPPEESAVQAPTAVPAQPVAQSQAPADVSVESLLHEAAEMLEAGDLEQARQEALEIASGVQKAQLEDVLEDLAKGDVEEVEEHLAALMGATSVSVIPLLHEAHEALEAGDLDQAKHELEEALEMAASDAQKAQIEDILEDLEKGELEEVEEHLAAMLAGTPQAMELALTGAAAEGHELFEQIGCAQCHGHNAEGGFGPALAGRTRDRVFRQVRNPVGEMPPFSPDQVSDADLEKIATFIETLTDERGLSGAAMRHLQTALEKLEAGDTAGALDEVKEAADRSVGEAHEQIEEIEHLLQEGNAHEAEDRARALLGPGAARGFLEEAREALEAGDLDKVREELDEALEVAEGSVRDLVEDLIEDLEKGELEEVEEHLDELLGEANVSVHEHSPEEHIAGHHGVPEEAAARENPIPATEDSIAKGAALFARNCAVCHGEQGEGDGPAAEAMEPKPANLHEDHVQSNSDGALFWIITHGRPETPMPPWDNVLSEEERWHLVNFLRTFKE